MIIADTGYWLALADRADRHHSRAVEAARTIRDPRITTWPVLTETCHLLGRRLGARSVHLLLASCAAGAARIADSSVHAPSDVAALVHRYSDLPLDLADATLVLLAEHLGQGRILSTDARLVGGVRWKTREPFEDLLLG